jgi:hypothetical protein
MAADSPIVSLARSLTPMIQKRFPEARMQVTDESYIAKHGTMDFTVHGRLKTGEILPQTRTVEGPNHEGFILRIRLVDGPYRGSAVVPQDLRDIYWTDFLNAVYVPEADKHLHILFSYGARLDQAFKKSVLATLP